MKRLALILALTAVLVVGCGGVPQPNGEEAKRFKVVHSESSPGSWYAFTLVQDTETGACWFIAQGYYKGGPAPAPKEACEAR